LSEETVSEETVSPDTVNRESSAIEVWADRGESAETLNARLAVTTSSHIALVPQGTHLSDRSLSLASSVVKRFDVDLAYADSASQGSVQPRPTYSPLRLREQDYLGPLKIFSSRWMRETGGFRAGLSAGFAYDFALRELDPVRTVRIPEQLTAVDSLAALTSSDLDLTTFALEAAGIDAVVGLRTDGTVQVRYAVIGRPLVSIVIPTRGTTAVVNGERRVLVIDAVRGILEKSSYREVEIVVVADDATPQDVIDELIAIAGPKLVLSRWSEEFNFSAKINRGAIAASGEYLLILNDDVAVITPDWIETMLAIAQQPGVGIVGPLLLFEDGTVQHGGHLYRQSWAGHVAPGWPIGQDDSFDSLKHTREVSGVTAACALLSAKNFEAVGGLSLDFAGNYNDVDLSLKIRGLGLSAVWTPDARLFHYESKTRDARIQPHEIAALRRRWGSQLLIDPFWTDER
jgi:GT2 family glycosyltransferase